MRGHFGESGALVKGKDEIAFWQAQSVEFEGRARAAGTQMQTSAALAVTAVAGGLLAAGAEALLAPALAVIKNAIEKFIQREGRCQRTRADGGPLTEGGSIAADGDDTPAWSRSTNGPRGSRSDQPSGGCERETTQASTRFRALAWSNEIRG